MELERDARGREREGDSEKRGDVGSLSRGRPERPQHCERTRHTFQSVRNEGGRLWLGGREEGQTAVRAEEGCPPPFL